MIKKQKCFKCDHRAVWWYVPSDELDKNARYYCDSHVSRGCSCNMDFDDAGNIIKEYLDEQGRQLPCCEYYYNPDGYEEEND